jgi:hypothetical protein
VDEYVSRRVVGSKPVRIEITYFLLRCEDDLDEVEMEGRTVLVPGTREDCDGQALPPVYLTRRG